MQLFNGGILPATVTFSMPSEGPFLCSAHGRRMSLEPKATQVVYVTFRPSAQGGFESTLTLSVANNAFEETSLLIRGDAFVQDVPFQPVESGAKLLCNYTTMQLYDCTTALHASAAPAG